MNGGVLTYLPYPDFQRSVNVLDDELLDEQRLGSVRLLEALLFGCDEGEWRPSADMWRGFEVCLFHLQLALYAEWRDRGFDDDWVLGHSGAVMVEGGMGQYVTRNADGKLIVSIPPREDPPWLGDQRLHRSHRAALVRLRPAYYRPRFPNVDEGVPLLFP